MDKIAKAIIGAATAASTGLLAGLADGHVTATEWVVVASGTIIAGFAVWATPNAPKE